MKIEGPRATSAPSSGRRAAGAAEGAGFSLPADGATRSAATAPSAGITHIDALLALQSDDPQKQRRARQTRRGRAALDALEVLAHGLLTGTAPGGLRGELERLRGEGELTGEAELDEVLREIDIRLAVEAAKLERLS